MHKPKALVGCEKSGQIRTRLEAIGFDAWSVDLQEADDKSPKHIVGSIFDIDHSEFSFAVIHPPCPRLCASSTRWYHKPPSGKTLIQMWEEFDEAVEFYVRCWNLPIKYLALENSKFNAYAKTALKNLGPMQVVQPYWFGDKVFKATQFQYRWMPPLRPTQMLEKPMYGTKEYQRWSSIRNASPSADRANNRARTMDGIANAVASQWGNYVLDKLRQE